MWAETLAAVESEHEHDLETIVAKLAITHEIDQAVNELLYDKVAEVRQHGGSWRKIGGVLGVTGSAANQRFAKTID